MSNNIKILSQYTLAALALIPLYAGAKLADTPFVLDNQAVTTGGSGTVKPNVMFLIDDSGSMNDTPNSQVGVSKLNITKSVLNQVLSQYKDTINWSLQTLNQNGNVGLNGYTTDYNDIIRRVNSITADGGTPTTRRYYEVSQFIRESTRYRCQKNYILLVSDGDSNLSCWIYDSRNRERSPTIPPTGQILPIKPSATLAIVILVIMLTANVLPQPADLMTRSGMPMKVYAISVKHWQPPILRLPATMTPVRVGMATLQIRKKTASANLPAKPRKLSPSASVMV